MPMVKTDVLQRFLDYVQIDTASVLPKADGKKNKPSSKGQTVLAGIIKKELLSWGCRELRVDDLQDGSLGVYLPASSGKHQNSLYCVFAAHLDTYFGLPGKAVPIVHNYKKGDIVLPNKAVIPASDLQGLEGERIVTSDGTTLLGGDDKAGVSAIVTIIELLVKRHLSHGHLYFWFGVDEESDTLDMNLLPKSLYQPWDFFCTLDGDRLGTIEVGCFNALTCEVTFKGVDAHIGLYGHKLKPAHYAAINFAEEITKVGTPMQSKEGQNLYYVETIEGSASKSVVRCELRSFDKNELDGMGNFVGRIAQLYADKFGCTVNLSKSYEYVNISSAISKRPSYIEVCQDAHRDLGIVAKLIPQVRGGTDGATINMALPDLPAPNLGIGVQNIHSFQEFLVVRELELLPFVVLNIIKKMKNIKK